MLLESLAGLYARSGQPAEVTAAFRLAQRLEGFTIEGRSGAKPLPASGDACPTCDGAGCKRCYATGRRHLCKIDVTPTTDGRAVVQLWQGAPGTMQVVALTAPDRDLADVTIDAWLACLQNGGLIIDDRRGR